MSKKHILAVLAVAALAAASMSEAVAQNLVSCAGPPCPTPPAGYAWRQALNGAWVLIPWDSKYDSCLKGSQMLGYDVGSATRFCDQKLSAGVLTR
jgi:opacity protein-like surface antigen